jgi:hypothetical protein
MAPPLLKQVHVLSKMATATLTDIPTASPNLLLIHLLFAQIRMLTREDNLRRQGNR